MASGPGGSLALPPAAVGDSMMSGYVCAFAGLEHSHIYICIHTLARVPCSIFPISSCRSVYSMDSWNTPAAASKPAPDALPASLRLEEMFRYVCFPQFVSLGSCSLGFLAAGSVTTS